MRPSVDDLLQVHPPGHGFSDLVGGVIGREIKKNGWETCASQISYALNHSGESIGKADIGKASNPNLLKGSPRALSDRDGQLYIFSVIDMIVYLDGKYGKAENIKGSAQNMRDAVEGRPGIITFGFRHVDLWYYEPIAKIFRSHYYILFNDPSAKKRGIYFWELGW